MTSSGNSQFPSPVLVKATSHQFQAGWGSGAGTSPCRWGADRLVTPGDSCLHCAVLAAARLKLHIMGFSGHFMALKHTMRRLGDAKPWWGTAEGGRSQAGAISFGQLRRGIVWSALSPGWHSHGSQQCGSPCAASVFSFGEESPFLLSFSSRRNTYSVSFSSTT